MVPGFDTGKLLKGCFYLLLLNSFSYPESLIWGRMMYVPTHDGDSLFSLGSLEQYGAEITSLQSTRAFHIHMLAPILIMYTTSQPQNAYFLSCYASMSLPDEGVDMIKAMTNRVPMTG